MKQGSVRDTASLINRRKRMDNKEKSHLRDILIFTLMAIGLMCYIMFGTGCTSLDNYDYRYGQYWETGDMRHISDLDVRSQDIIAELRSKSQ